jgi:hypothetical protein
MSEPIYVGNAKKGKFPNSVSIGFTIEHLRTLSKNINEGGWVNLLVSPQRQNPDKYSVKIDDWKPQRAEEHAERERQGFQPNDSLPDIPLGADGRPDKDSTLPF